MTLKCYAGVVGDLKEYMRDQDSLLLLHYETYKSGYVPSTPPVAIYIVKMKSQLLLNNRNCHSYLLSKNFATILFI